MARKTIFVLWLAALALAPLRLAVAQQAAKIPRVGIVRGDRTEQGTNIKRFQQALQELGYVEGKISCLSIATPMEVEIAPKQSWPNS